jgi:hypothetical protein
MIAFERILRGAKRKKLLWCTVYSSVAVFSDTLGDKALQYEKLAVVACLSVMSTLNAGLSLAIRCRVGA